MNCSEQSAHDAGTCVIMGVDEPENPNPNLCATIRESPVSVTTKPVMR